MLTIFAGGIADEIKFLLRLQESLLDCSVEKTVDEFNPLDYIVAKDGKILLYLELKSRNTDLSLYDSLIIGRAKIENIFHIREHIILIWICKTTNTLYYLFYHKRLLELKTHILNGKRIVYINKQFCSSGYDNLIADIAELIV